jgi:predicted dienelactone hydrolase
MAMRVLLLSIALLSICFGSIASARAPTSNAGIARIAVPAQEPFDTLVWYPTPQEAAFWQVGPFTVPATHNATVAPGQFPIVLLSHGGGQTGGSPLLLNDLSARLAREGFIVIAPFHGKTRFLQRPRQVGEALEAVRADARFKSHIVSDRVGMLGFSLGGAVTLTLAGGVPNFQQLATYCAMHSDDVQSCNAGPGSDRNADLSTQTQAPPSGLTIPRLPLKGLALLDPFGVLFQRGDLLAVSMPVLLLRPEQSRMGEENTRALVANLPRPPQLHHVPGGHFVFTDICAPALRVEAPAMCVDAAGVDRSAIHADVGARIVEFFRSTL